MRLYDLLCNELHDPVGIGCGVPRFSWKLADCGPDTVQVAYRIEIEGFCETGKVTSSDCFAVPVAAAVLREKTAYAFRVTVWDNHGNEATGEGTFETGARRPSGRWISAARTPLATTYAFYRTDRWERRDYILAENGQWVRAAGERHERVPVFCRAFDAPGALSRARLYITAYGLYEVYLNGRRVSDAYLTPGFTAYDKRLQVQTYPVEEYLRAGENELEIFLARGWCCGRFPFNGEKNTISKYTRVPALLCDLEMTDRAGGQTKVVSDENWRWHGSGYTRAEIYDGEVFDAGYTDGEKRPVLLRGDLPFDNLVPTESEPVRILGEIAPVAVSRNAAGQTILDFGQEISGCVAFRVRGKAGERVVLSHGEILTPDGDLYTENLRSAMQNVTYTLRGGEEECYHAHFSTQCFRYVRVDEYPAKVEPEAFTACVMSSDMPETGRFSCSEPLLNRLFRNTVRSQKDNFIDIPTDCPQRDERMGWTADFQIFLPTAAQNAFVLPFTRKWLRDLSADQLENGSVPHCIPNAAAWTETAAAWADAAVTVPYALYRAYGDKSVLEEQYPSMQKWVSYVRDTGNDPFLWNTGYQFGDWLGLDAAPGSYHGATNDYLVATAYYANSVALMEKIAGVLGKEDDRAQYAAWHGRIMEAFRRTYMREDGSMTSETQTAYALACAFDLAADKRNAANRLAAMIRKDGGKIKTGFVGTPLLLEVLEQNGHGDAAFDLLFNRTFPSWLYPVTKGATTIWEHWDGIMPDGTLWIWHMNSFNHYAYGSVCDFLYRRVAGILPAEAGYARIEIDPCVTDKLTYAEASLETVRGRVFSRWERKEDGILYRFEIPANARARFHGKEYPSGNYEIFEKM